MKEKEKGSFLLQTYTYQRLIFIVWVVLFMFQSTNAQQLEKIGKKDPVKINGGINVNQVYRTNATGDTNPYSLVLNGNVSTSIYGMSVPLSFTWSNYQWTYTQPFNQFTLSPSYKWVTTHIGWSSMSFSPYSLNGHSFSGLGVELNPNEKVKLSAMYGRLLKASAGDTINGYKPQYKRMGSGLKAEYQFKFGDVGVHFFRAWDDDEKPVEYIDSLGVAPQENLVVGTSFSIRPFKSIALSGEYSVSALSEDNRISKASELEGAATFLHHAIKSDLTWSTRLGSLGGGIEYVEPGYNTLGSYYMVNDFINYTVNATTSIVNGKVNVAASVGIRETNINDQSETDQKDVINNINISFVPSDKLSFNLNYSNFYNYSFVRPLFDETNTHTEYELMDTLRFTQINENFALSANWGVKVTEEQKHNIMASVNVQQATQSQSDAIENSNTNFFNGSGGYSWSLVKSDFNLGLNMNYSRNKLPDAISEAYGPILSVRKGMLEKTLRHRLSLSWNGTYVDNVKNGDVLTARLGSNYTIKKKHRLNLSFAWSKRTRNTGEDTSYTTATLGYSYQFGWPKKGNEQP